MICILNFLKIYILNIKTIYTLIVVKYFLVVINAQIERKRKLASELSTEKQRLEIMKRNVVLMEKDIARRRTYSRKVCILHHKFVLL